MRRGTIIYVVVRLLLWGAAVSLAWLPTVWIVWSLHLGSSLWLVNIEGHFRDLFFALVPAAALSISSILEFFYVSRESPVERLAALLALLANIVVLLSAFFGFLLYPDQPVLSVEQFRAYSALIIVGLIVSFVTELSVAVINGSRRRTAAGKR
jgi:hypothetical protein